MPQALLRDASRVASRAVNRDASREMPLGDLHPVVITTTAPSAAWKTEATPVFKAITASPAWARRAQLLLSEAVAVVEGVPVPRVAAVVDTPAAAGATAVVVDGDRR